VSTEAARAGIETALRALLDAEAIEESLAGRLRAAAAERDPRSARAGIIHTDLCAENLVVDPGGIVRAVDNEGLRIGPTGFDLARVWYRWPMSASAWSIPKSSPIGATYVSAYARLADPEPALAHFVFWKLAAVLHSARVRIRRGIAAAEVPLARLRALAGEL
jgi:Ser/Thr protein kinase RdoA (MazF antagonist)